jgi:putative ABC transport system substrate-binding protein
VRRRAFIAALGGAAAWPIVVRAQQPGAMRRIGALLNRTADDPEASNVVGAFAQGLAEFGGDYRPQRAGRSSLGCERC